MKLAAVSVDLDEIACYAAIHGLDESASFASAHPVYDRALPRLHALFVELGIPATWFVIGRDLARDDNARTVRRLHAHGDEIGNHSHSHFYDLTRRPREEQREQVARGADAIEAATGLRPVGFRAPGYTITDTLATILSEEGVAYDASVFPCPPYYLAKAAAMAAMRLSGRRSRSILDDPRVVMAPADPYRMGARYLARGDGLLEIPNGVTPWYTGRLPFIGTSLVLAGASMAARLSAAMAKRPFVSLELHGIDLADAHEDGLSRLTPHQPDLRKPWRDKRAALAAAIEALRARGFSFVCLREACTYF